MRTKPELPSMNSDESVLYGQFFNAMTGMNLSQRVKFVNSKQLGIRQIARRASAAHFEIEQLAKEAATHA